MCQIESTAGRVAASSGSHVVMKRENAGSITDLPFVCDQMTVLSYFAVR